MRRTILTLIVMLGIGLDAFAQIGLDPVYSQYYSNALYLNPALAGSHICPRIKLIRRAQWPGIPTSYVSNYLSYDQFHFGMNAGLGVTLSYESLGEGIVNSYSFSVAYSKKADINKNLSITGGLQGGWGLNQLNWNKLNFADQLDFQLGFVLPTGVTKPSYTSRQIWDVNAGLMLEYKDRLYIGIAGHHLTSPENGFIPTDNSRLDRKYSLYFSYEIPLKGLGKSTTSQDYNPSISPSLLYQRQGIFNNILGGLYFNWYPFNAGVWMRHAVYNSDAIAILIGFEQKNYKINYSFDYTISKLTLPSSLGSQEISFTWLFACPDFMKKRIKAVKCPTFLK